MLSRTSLLHAQHGFDPHRYRYLVSRLRTMRQGSLLVRLSITYLRPHSTRLNHHINDITRNGQVSCNGLGNVGFSLIILAVCTYHRIDPHHNPPQRYLH